MGCYCLTHQNSCSHFVHACQLFHIVAVTCLPVIDTEKWPGPHMLTTYPVLFCMFSMSFMRFANLKEFHKALDRTHQIKGQYKPICLKQLELELITGKPFLHLLMSSLWVLWVTLKNAINKLKVMIIILMLCYLNVLKFCSPPTHQPPLPYSGPISLKFTW